MKALIALAAAAACVALGGISARRLALREEETRRWDRALMTLEGELEGGGLPLPQLMEKAGVDTLKTGAQLLRDHPGLSPEEMGARLSPPPLLTPPEWQIILTALRGLFAPTVPQQLMGLRHARGEWARALETCRTAAEKNIRLYQSLGWLSGAAVFILLC
ncbi:MAG: hypothetical protein E7324_07495 [Clostridiales bacterium]|nr:hypothetical protein [Clostridiales bacterium]